jgi:hypothetical protein
MSRSQSDWTLSRFIDLPKERAREKQETEHGANETRTQTRIIKNTTINLHKIGGIRLKALGELRMDLDPKAEENEKNEYFVSL